MGRLLTGAPLPVFIMGNLDTSVFDSDLAAVIADLPATLVWKGQTITGMKGETNLSDEVQVPGFMREISQTFQGQISSFADSTVLPKPGDLVTLDDVSLRVGSSQNSPDNIMIEITLDDPTP